MVSFAKLGSWFLLLIVSYSMVALINKPREIDAETMTDQSLPANAKAA